MLAVRATVSRFPSQALVCSGARNRFIHVGARKKFDLRVRRFSEGNGGQKDEELGIQKNEGMGIRLNEAALSEFLGVVCEGGGVANPLEGVAELDHARRERTNFPEVGEATLRGAKRRGKTRRYEREANCQSLSINRSVSTTQPPTSF